jgi:hypothetical protein
MEEALALGNKKALALLAMFYSSEGNGVTINKGLGAWYYRRFLQESDSASELRNDKEFKYLMENHLKDDHAAGYHLALIHFKIISGEITHTPLDIDEEALVRGFSKILQEHPDDFNKEFKRGDSLNDILSLLDNTILLSIRDASLSYELIKEATGLVGELVDIITLYEVGIEDIPGIKNFMHAEKDKAIKLTELKHFIWNNKTGDFLASKCLAADNSYYAYESYSSYIILNDNSRFTSEFDGKKWAEIEKAELGKQTFFSAQRNIKKIDIEEKSKREESEEDQAFRFAKAAEELKARLNK